MSDGRKSDSTRRGAKAAPAVDRDLLDMLLEAPLFSQLNTGQLEMLCGYMGMVRKAAGEWVFKEGDRGNYVYFVVDGVVEVVKQNHQGKPVVIASLPKGRSFGEMALLDRFNRSASVRAVRDVTLLTLSDASFERMIDSQPKIAVFMLRNLAQLLSFNLRRTSAGLADHLVPPGEDAA